MDIDERIRALLQNIRSLTADILASREATKQLRDASGEVQPRLQMKLSTIAADIKALERVARHRENRIWGIDGIDE